MVVHRQHFIKDIYCSMERETQITDTSGFTFFNQVIQHSVVDITSTEGFNTTISNRVQQIIINIIGLQVLERLLVHGNRILACPVLEV